MAQFDKPQREVDSVFLHCSASDRPNHDDVEVIRKWHLANGWNDIGYHYFIRKDGEIQPGRSLEKMPAAQGRGKNRGTIAICCHGLALEKFTRAQYESVIALCSEINEAYRREVTFHGHREVANKACPVFPYKVVLGLNEDGYMVHGTNADPSAEDEEETADQPMPVLKLFAKGAAVRALQRALKRHGHELAVDGKFGRGTREAVVAFQKANGLDVDGIVGRRTWAALEP